jgi:hypothetical protein
MIRRLLLPVALVLPLLAPTAAQAARGTDTGPVVATIETARGRFRAVISDPAMIELARQELAGGTDAGVPNGPLAHGSGGVNHGHRWHITELRFDDFTIELCDGTARMVDRDTQYWVETVGAFCPWSGRVVKLKPR